MTDIPRSLLFNMEETEIYFDNPHLTAINVRGEKQFQSDVEAIASWDARILSLLLLTELYCLHFLFLRLDRVAVLQGSYIKSFYLGCLDAFRRNFG